MSDPPFLPQTEDLKDLLKLFLLFNKNIDTSFEQCRYNTQH